MANILFIHHNSRDIGGADYCQLRVVKAAQASGQHTCFVLLRERTFICSLYDQAGIPVFIKTLLRIEKKPILFLFPFLLVYELFVIRTLVKKYNITLIHTNDLFDFTGNIAARILGLPSCQSVKTILYMDKAYNRLIAWLSHTFADKLICASQNVKEILYPADTDKAEVIYDWVDFKASQQDGRSVPVRQELGLDASTLVIGCIGRIVPRKGQDVFLQAAEYLGSKYQDVHFLVIGNPVANSRFYAGLMAAYHASPVKNRIHFLSHRDDIDSIMRQMDVVVNSSSYPDPFPGVVLEAMTCGRIVIGADEGGMPEQIDHGVTGFLFRARDSRDLADKMELALNAKRTGSIKPEQIIRRVQDLFPPEKSISEWLALYAALLRAR